MSNIWVFTTHYLILCFVYNDLSAVKQIQNVDEAVYRLCDLLCCLAVCCNSSGRGGGGSIDLYHCYRLLTFGRLRYWRAV